MRLAFVTATLLAATTARADTVTAARAAWAKCFAAGAHVPDFPSAPDPGDPSTELTITKTARGFRLHHAWGGSGHEAVYGGLELDFAPDGCVALWSEDGTYDGAFAWRVRVGWIHRGKPNARELADLGMPPATPDSAPSAMARAWLGHECAGGPDSPLPDDSLFGPIAPAQPWHAGKPTASAASFWSIAALDAIGEHAHLRPTDDDDLKSHGGPELAGIYVPGLAAPSRAFQRAAFELYEAELPGRNAGRAIAFYDRAKDRHRWVMLTRGCVQGTTVRWLGVDGARVVGITRSLSGRYAKADAVVVIDTSAGTASAQRLPQAIREADTEPRATLSAGVVTLVAGSAHEIIDLTH
jgi:hypothetical protein